MEEFSIKNSIKVPHLIRIYGNELVFCGSQSEAHKWLKKKHINQSAAYVIYDPCGTMLNIYGSTFSRYGYDLKTFDAAACRAGVKYNPFEYIKDDGDISKLVAVIFGDTHSCEKFNDFYSVICDDDDLYFADDDVFDVLDNDSALDDSFVSAEQLLLSAIIGFVHENGHSDERNFGMVNEMLQTMDFKVYGGYSEDSDDDYKTAVDYMFEAEEERNPQSSSAGLYKQFKATPYRNDQKVVDSCIERIAPLATKQALKLMSADELRLDKLHYRRTVLFIRGGNCCSDLELLIPFVYSQILERLRKRIFD